MKVCMVSTFPPHPGGTSNYFDKLSRKLSKHVHLIALADIKPTKSSDAKEPCYKIKRVWRPNSITYPLEIVFHAFEMKPNTVHINHEYMLYGNPFFSLLFPLVPFLIRLARIKVVITMHSVVSKEALDNKFFGQYGGGKHFSMVKKIAFTLVTKIIVAFASKVIVHSHFSRKVLNDDYGANANKIVVFPHGVEEVSTYEHLKAKELLALKNEKVILFFGFVSRKKGLKHLVSAMPSILRECKDACLVVAGGPYPSLLNDYKVCVDEVKRLINDLHLNNNVILTNSYIPDDLVHVYFGAADVVVLPHVQAFGASGILSLAAAHAKPVVVTDHPIFKYYVKNGVNGLVVHKGSSKELADGIIGILSDEKLRSKLGKCLREYASAASWDKLAKSHLELYSSLTR